MRRTARRAAALALVPFAAGLAQPRPPGRRPARAELHAHAAAPVAVLPPASDGVLVAVRVGPYAEGSVLALQRDGVLLLPARAFFALAGVRLQARGPRLTGVWHPGDLPVVVDPAASVVRLGRRAVPATPGELVTDGGQTYAAAALVERVFGVRLVYAAADATLTVDGADLLPVAQRAVHAARRVAALEARRATADAAVPDADRGHGATRGALIDYTVTRSGSLLPGGPGAWRAGSTTTGTVGVATSLGAGVLAVRAAAGPTGAPAGGRAGAAWTWDRAAGHRVRQLRVGDAASDGLRPFALRGVALTNAAPTRDQGVTSAILRGLVPPGWSVEAYRGGALLAVDSVATEPAADPAAVVDADALDGGAPRPFTLRVPASAGQSTFDVVAVGPDGELKNFQRMVHVRPMGLAAGAFEYRVAAGACDPRDLPRGATRAQCGGRVSADLRYGVTERVAVRGGVEGTRRRGRAPMPGAGLHPYVAVAATPWNALSLAGEHSAGEVDHVSARFQPSTAFLLSAERTVARDVWVPAIAVAGAPVLREMDVDPAAPWRRSAVSQASTQLVASPHLLRGVVLEAHDLRAAWSGGAWQEQRVGGAVATGVAEVRTYVRRETVSPAPARTLAGVSATLLPVRAAARVLGRGWVMATTEVTPTGAPAHAEVMVARPVGGSWRVDAGAQWDRRSPGYRGTIAFTSQLPSVRASTRTGFASAGARGISTHTLSGSATLDASSGAVTFSADPAIDRGGIAGRVFLDANGNGRRDHNEPGIPGAQLQLATRTVSTDAGGNYRVVGLAPDAVVRIALDSASLTSPWWVPAVAAQYVRATAGRLTRVDYPVMLGGIVNGRVSALRAGHPAPLPPGTHVRLGADSVGADDTPQRVDVFSDGGFSFSGVPPGSYWAAVEPPAGDTLWRTPAVRVVVAPGVPALDASGPLVDDVALVLRREDAVEGVPVADTGATAQASEPADPGAPPVVHALAESTRSAAPMSWQCEPRQATVRTPHAHHRRVRHAHRGTTPHTVRGASPPTRRARPTPGTHRPRAARRAAGGPAEVVGAQRHTRRATTPINGSVARRRRPDCKASGGCAYIPAAPNPPTEAKYDATSRACPAPSSACHTATALVGKQRSEKVTTAGAPRRSTRASSANTARGRTRYCTLTQHSAASNSASP